MTHRFPPLRSQAQMARGAASANRSLPVPTAVDLTLLAALILVVALALI